MFSVFVEPGFKFFGELTSKDARSLRATTVTYYISDETVRPLFYILTAFLCDMDFCHVFLKAVWSKLISNPIEISSFS